MHGESGPAGVRHERGHRAGPHVRLGRVARLRQRRPRPHVPRLVGREEGRARRKARSPDARAIPLHLPVPDARTRPEGGPRRPAPAHHGERRHLSPRGGRGPRPPLRPGGAGDHRPRHARRRRRGAGGARRRRSRSSPASRSRPNTWAASCTCWGTSSTTARSSTRPWPTCAASGATRYRGDDRAIACPRRVH